MGFNPVELLTLKSEKCMEKTKKQMAEDTALFRMMVQGETEKSQAAFGALFRKYRKWLLAFLLTKIKRMEDCEEIAQDLMLVLWNSRTSLSGIVEDIGVERLLRVLAKRKVVDYYRKTKPVGIVLELDVEGRLKQGEGKDVVFEYPDNERQVILEKVDRAMIKEKVGPRDRRMFLDFINKVPIEEICRRTRYKKKTIYWKVQAIRKLLLKYLRPYLEDYCLELRFD